MNSLIALGIAAALLTAAVYYGLVARATYNLLDPVVVEGIFLPFSGALLAVLCASGLVTWDKLVVFTAALTGYALGAHVVTTRFRRATFRMKLLSVASSFTRAEASAVLLLALLFTTLLAALALALGAEGDARQHFQKLFRPLFLFQHGLFLICLILLLSNRFSHSRAAAWVGTLAILSIPFSGKSVALPVLYWLGLRRFVSGRQITFRAMLISALVALGGFAVMAIVGFKVRSLSGVLFLLAIRLWLSGDVYILAYQAGALADVRQYYHPEFIRYMLHPITDLVGIRAYQYPLGAMLASAVAGETKLTGPNPQLPVVLDFFFPHSPIVIGLIAFVIGFLVLGIRALSTTFSDSRARFIRVGGVAAAIFAPSPGFIDNEQVLMRIVGIAAVVAVGSLMDLFGRAPSFPPALAENAKKAEPS